MILTHHLSRYREVGAQVVVASTFSFLSHLTRTVPGGLEYRVAEAVAMLAYFTWRRRREVVIRNCANVLQRPPQDRQVRRIARAVFRDFSRTLVDILKFADIDSEDIARLITVTGLEHLNEALAHGRGVLLTFCHFGNWEVGGRALPLLIPNPINAIAETAGLSYLTKVLVKQRGSKGIRVIPMETALKRLYKALANNEIVGIAVDRYTPDNGVVVNFCGTPTRVPVGAAAIAARTGAAIVPCVFYRLPNGRYRGVVEPPIFASRQHNGESDYTATLQTVFSTLEKYVVAYPEQYYKFQPMWPEYPGLLEPVTRPA